MRALGLRQNSWVTILSLSYHTWDNINVKVFISTASKQKYISLVVSPLWRPGALEKNDRGESYVGCDIGIYCLSNSYNPEANSEEWKCKIKYIKFWIWRDDYRYKYCVIFTFPLFWWGTSSPASPNCTYSVSKWIHQRKILHNLLVVR